MKKFAIFSGFLGAGKTTAMMALTKYLSSHSVRAAMISNDLGEGVELADDRFARLSGCNAHQITDSCICYCHDVLTDRLSSCYDEGCELVISDIPGFGVGALEHVYHGLSEERALFFELAPFTVITEPRTVKQLFGGGDGDKPHITDAQLREADLIVLNKIDLIDAEEAKELKKLLSSRYPEAVVIAISAREGSGLDELAGALLQGRASMRHPDINYGDERLAREMDSLSEYYIQYYAEVCCEDFDGTAYLRELACAVQTAVAACGCEIPHLKLLAWEPEGDFGRVDLLGRDRPVEITRSFERPCTAAAVILNGSAACPADRLDEIMTGAVKEVSEKYRLDTLIHMKDFFNMGE